MRRHAQPGNGISSPLHVLAPRRFILLMWIFGLAWAEAHHRSARLYRALVEREIAVSASAHYRPSVDPGTFYFEGTVRDGRTLAEFEAALNVEIDRICQEPVSADELAKVRKQVRAQFAYTIERVSNQAYWLGWMEMLGDWRRFDTFVDNLSAVTAADVQRVAQTYLKPSNRTIGWFEPVNL
jgi:zinc protease